jgi:hypothetical protein
MKTRKLIALLIVLAAVAATGISFIEAQTIPPKKLCDSCPE